MVFTWRHMQTAVFTVKWANRSPRVFQNVLFTVCVLVSEENFIGIRNLGQYRNRWTQWCTLHNTHTHIHIFARQIAIILDSTSTRTQHLSCCTHTTQAFFWIAFFALTGYILIENLMFFFGFLMQMKQHYALVWNFCWIFVEQFSESVGELMHSFAIWLSWVAGGCCFYKLLRLETIVLFLFVSAHKILHTITYGIRELAFSLITSSHLRFSPHVSMSFYLNCVFSSIFI